MKLPIQFFIVGILILTFASCNLQSSTIDMFENVELSYDLFSWQQDEYCPFEDELFISEIRCSFEKRTEFSIYDPKSPEWYFRYYDEEFNENNLELSGINIIMNSNRRHTFPMNKDEAEKYWAEFMKFYPEKPEYTLESLLIDEKSAWKMMLYTDGDISLPSREEKHSSIIMGQYLLEKDNESIYLILVSIMSDSPEKVVAYQAEADHFISSLRWK